MTETFEERGRVMAEETQEWEVPEGWKVGKYHPAMGEPHAVVLKLDDGRVMHKLYAPILPEAVWIVDYVATLEAKAAELERVKDDLDRMTAAGGPEAVKAAWEESDRLRREMLRQADLDLSLIGSANEDRIIQEQWAMRAEHEKADVEATVTTYETLLRQAMEALKKKEHEKDCRRLFLGLRFSTSADCTCGLDTLITAIASALGEVKE